MPSTRKMILNHVMSGICSKINRTKQLPSDVMETPLKRCLNTFDITLLGIGHMVGAGIYVLTGSVTKNIAGPGIIISFLLAGVASLLSALCYSEFGTRVPKAGSAYAYTYVSVGEFWAFVIGWNIILEHMIGAASVARAWSGYVNFLFDDAISNATLAATGEMHQVLLGKYPDFLAFLVCIVYASLLGFGVKGSAIFNSILTILNLAVMVLVISVGFYYSDITNWTASKGGFFPYGFGGVISGAATCFYAFVGFDSIATAGEEAKDPSFSIPVATISSMVVVTLGYILVCAALTLLVPFDSVNPNAALPEAFSGIGLHWVKYLVSIGAICGMTTTLVGSLFSLPRCMYAMAQDGLLFSFLGNVNSKTQVPLTNLVISGLLSALIALLFDLEKLVEFMSIGTLLAYTIVSASIIILRYKPTTEGFPRKPATSPSCSESSSSYSETPTPVLDFCPVPGTLKPQFGWLFPIFGMYKPGRVVTMSVFVFMVFSCALCFLLHGSLKNQTEDIWWIIVIATFFVTIMALSLIAIAAHHQNVTGLKFKVPLVPFLPALSIFCNLGFMVHLNVLTWIRFFIWMVLGMLVYFLYGIHHSKEGDTNSSYSMLMTSSEAVKEKWGATTKSKIKGTLTKRKGSGGDSRNAIIDEEELVQ
ncbi:cationic amino acid transporter 4 [Agrilus planipennis]|uniref:Cationic amino acid transporter 4 n=1 Tax=Agrilus planipennis TaxID=224129 RepID=A0A1W4WIX7_AGRPL|nr:cationic amino acid transporter 4 [Agrilus planipennis]XP_018323885.1 cationic amino acid transporter 4 [Agrilus planipennis]